MTLTDTLQPVLEKKFPAALVAALLFATSSLAGNDPGSHLEPVASPPGYAWDGSAIIAIVFKEAFETDVLVRMHSSSAFMPTEDMVFLKKKNNSYRVIYLHSDILLAIYTPGAISQFGRERLSPRDYHAIRPTRCEIGIPAPLAENIVRVWREALLNTRYDRSPRRGADGGWAEFSMLDGYQWLAGRTWSPEAGTVPYEIEGVAGAMQDYCAKRNVHALAELTRKTTALVKRLKSEH